MYQKAFGSLSWFLHEETSSKSLCLMWWTTREKRKSESFSAGNSPSTTPPALANGTPIQQRTKFNWPFCWTAYVIHCWCGTFFTFFLCGYVWKEHFLFLRLNRVLLYTWVVALSLLCLSWSSFVFMVEGKVHDTGSGLAEMCILAED